MKKILILLSFTTSLSTLGYIKTHCSISPLGYSKKISELEINNAGYVDRTELDKVHDELNDLKDNLKQAQQETEYYKSFTNKVCRVELKDIYKESPETVTSTVPSIWGSQEYERIAYKKQFQRSEYHIVRNAGVIGVANTAKEVKDLLQKLIQDGLCE